jgi:transcriptional regulator with XRE-family HTH domain
MTMRRRCGRPPKEPPEPEKTENEKLGQRMRTMRGYLGLTQTAVSKLLECDASNVNKMEQGRQGPTLAQLRKLARLYRCSIDELTDVDGPLPRFVSASHR